MIKINVYAESSGKAWLFDDLKQHFENIKKENVAVISSNFPLNDADAYIAIRTHEASRSPKPEKTVACIHDLYNDRDIYKKGGERHAVAQAGALVLCHPEQRKILKKAEIDLSNISVMERPLGALAAFRPAEAKPPKFTIAWVGRNYWRKRIDWFMEAIYNLQLDKKDFRVILLGMDVEEPASQLQQKGIECLIFPRKDYPISSYPEIYQQMSCLVITGITEAGPLTLFEALATGLPVISTKVGWAPFFAEQASKLVRLVDQPADISTELQKMYNKQEQYFQQRLITRGLVSQWTLDNWVEQVVDQACALVNASKLIPEL